MGRGDVAVVIQAVHAGKAGGGAAQLLRLLVHHGHKVGQTAVRHVAGDDAGGVVGAGDQKPVQQVDAAHRLADAEVHGAAIGVLDVLELLRQAGGDGDLRVQIFAAFEEEQGRHHLGQAGDVALLVDVLFQDGLVDVRVEQVDRFALIGGLDGHLVHGQTRQCSRDGQHSRQQQGSGPAEEGVFLHEHILPKDSDHPSSFCQNENNVCFLGAGAASAGAGWSSGLVKAQSNSSAASRKMFWLLEPKITRP